MGDRNQKIECERGRLEEEMFHVKHREQASSTTSKDLFGFLGSAGTDDILAGAVAMGIWNVSRETWAGGTPMSTWDQWISEMSGTAIEPAGVTGLEGVDCFS